MVEIEPCQSEQDLEVAQVLVVEGDAPPPLIAELGEPWEPVELGGGNVEEPFDHEGPLVVGQARNRRRGQSEELVVLARGEGCEVP